MNRSVLYPLLIDHIPVIYNATRHAFEVRVLVASD